MRESTRILSRRRRDDAVHARRLEKPDGRYVLLYGFSPNDSAVLSDGLDGGPKRAELRRHPLRDEWFVYAAGRQNRTFMPSAADDPLAPMTPDGPATEIPVADFELAVFENRFPSFSDGASAFDAPPPGVETAPATGRCEVVVYTPAPTGSLATLTQDRRELLVHAWIDRYAELYAAGAAFVLPFENRGEEVGVTLLHPHGQIYAFPIVPTAQAAAARAFANGYDLAAAMPLWREDYWIADVDGVVAFAPPFARFPYETWIAPFAPRAGPWAMTDDEVSGFAALLGDVTRRYDAFFGRDCPYMLSLHAAPRGDSPNWHFTAQFYPLLRAPDKIKFLASVEQSTGLFTVDVTPEDAAIALRAV
ncbi:MAG: galactose-1-phosphate uridylyltransferase [Parvularculaceae bacterium]